MSAGAPRADFEYEYKIMQDGILRRNKHCRQVGSVFSVHLVVKAVDTRNTRFRQ